MAKERQPTMFGIFDANELSPGAKVSSALPPHQRHSATSRASAVAFKANLPAMEQVVYDQILSCRERGCTDNEGIAALVAAYPAMPNTYRARRISLLDRCLIEKVGVRRNGNRDADIYVASAVIMGTK